MISPASEASHSPDFSREVALSTLRRGGRGRIVRVLETANASRLKAMGLCEGREIEVLSAGQGWVIRVLGSRIGLTNQLAESVVLAV